MLLRRRHKKLEQVKELKQSDINNAEKLVNEAKQNTQVKGNRTNRKKKGE